MKSLSKSGAVATVGGTASRASNLCTASIAQVKSCSNWAMYACTSRIATKDRTAGTSIESAGETLHRSAGGLKISLFKPIEGNVTENIESTLP